MIEVVLIQSAEYDWFELFKEHGDRFEKPFARTLELLSIHPELGPPAREDNRFRRVIVRGSTWGVFYRFEGNRVVISGIFDLRQNPSEIRRRLTGNFPK